MLNIYRGPGTEWRAPAYADPALAHPDHDEDLAQRMSTQAVALFHPTP